MVDVKNKVSIYTAILVWLCYTILHVCCVGCLFTTMPLDTVIYHSTIRSVLLALLLLLLIQVLQHNGFRLLSVSQQIFNNSVLCLLWGGIWLGGGYIFDNLIFGEDTALLFLPLFPFYGLIAILFFIITFLMNRQEHLDKSESVDIEQVEEDIKPDDAVEQMLDRIVVKSGTNIHIVPINKIVYLRADGDYVHIRTGDAKYMKESTMKYFQQHLPAQQFVRIHRSTIVNVEQISCIALYEKQQQQLTLKNGDTVKVSAAGYKALRQALRL
ncbi:MAG: LytTR family transcriptional regulator DNA-binding domain-containing protein [Prevotellaceae bacterium]|jgi:hypothetical protein|nr:LytTR family transcriptional regulator DNA-binding domain-containing protein [Prevotellaceae bacterium]